jgi:hypothetical protein
MRNTLLLRITATRCTGRFLRKSPRVDRHRVNDSTPGRTAVTMQITSRNVADEKAAGGDSSAQLLDLL